MAGSGSGSGSGSGTTASRKWALPAPRPKSPPEYPDLYGKRRQLSRIQLLERQIGFLEDELKFVDALHPASLPCKEVTDYVGANSDPFMPTSAGVGKNCGFWKWLCGSQCFNLLWSCCCCCCSNLHTELPNCCNCTIGTCGSGPSCIRCFCGGGGGGGGGGAKTGCCSSKDSDEDSKCCKMQQQPCICSNCCIPNCSNCLCKGSCCPTCSNPLSCCCARYFCFNNCYICS